MAGARSQRLFGGPQAVAAPGCPHHGQAGKIDTAGGERGCIRQVRRREPDHARARSGQRSKPGQQPPPGNSPSRTENPLGTAAAREKAAPPRQTRCRWRRSSRVTIITVFLYSITAAGKGGYDDFQAGGCHGQIQRAGERRAQDPVGRRRHPAALRFAQRHRTQRAQVRLRARAMRRLHRAGRRQAGALMRNPDVGRQGAGHHNRRPRHARRAAPAAARVHRGAGLSVRLLRQRHGDVGQGAARAQSCPDGKRDQAGAERPPVPLRLAQSHRACRAARGEGDAVVTSRRQFLKSSGALVIGFSLAPELALPQVSPARLPGSLNNNRMLDAWLRIDPNGSVTIFSGKIELGQGIGTALSQIAADELDLDLKRIAIVHGDTALTPDEGQTAGSQSVEQSGTALRFACGAAYVQDIRLPGMLFGRVVRPPSPDAELVSVNEAAVRGMRGVVALVRDGRFLAVAAEREEQAVRAREALKKAAVWKERASLPPAGDALYEHMMALPVAGQTVTEKTSATAAPAVKSLEARYTRPYQAHGSIGPSCAVAQWQEGKLAVWTHSQGVFPLRADLAKLFGVEPAAVRCTHVEGAGCYGHNGADDVALDAALLARATGGRPVKLQWMRDDEFMWEPYGSAMVMKLAGGLDSQGNIVGWSHELRSHPHSTRPGASAGVDLLAAQHPANPLRRPP